MGYRLVLSYRFDTIDEILPKEPSLIFPGKFELTNAGQRLWKWETSWHKAEGCFTKIMFYYYMIHLIVNNSVTTNMRIKLLQQTDTTSFMFMKQQLYAGWRVDKQLKVDNEKDYVLLSTKLLERTYCLIVNDKNEIVAYRSFDDFKAMMLKISVEDSSILITGDKLVDNSKNDKPVTIPEKPKLSQPSEFMSTMERMHSSSKYNDSRGRWEDEETCFQARDDGRIDVFSDSLNPRGGYYHDPYSDKDYIVTKFGDHYCFKDLNGSDDRYACLNLYADTYFKIKPY